MFSMVTDFLGGYTIVTIVFIIDRFKIFSILQLQR